MIDRYLLRYFLAVVDTGNFSKGAAQVNVTQPTLSVGIAKLERLIGAPLFHRSSQRVSLTQAGSRLVAHARRIENDFDLAVRSVLEAVPRRIIRLGVLSTLPTVILEKIVAEHQRSDTTTQIEIVDGSERDLVSRLGRRRIDVALTVLRARPEWQEELLFKEGYSVALPHWHRLSGSATIRAAELAEEVMIVRRHCEALPQTSRHFTEQGVRPRFSFRTTNDDKALALVRTGLGITVMPDCYRDPGVTRIRLEGFDISREIGLVHDRDPDLTAVAKPLLAAIRNAVGDLNR